MSLIADTRLKRLASLVEQDIRSRGLRPGDRYLNTHEVAALLSISTRLANDAMRMLAERQILTRKPKAGTVIGAGLRPDENETPRQFDVIHLLVRHDYFLAERDRMDAIVTGLVEILPGCDIQFSFVPAFNEKAHTERLISSSAGNQRAYIIAVKSPQLQRLFAKSSLPVVLLGTPFPGIGNLPWIDKDQAAIGRILTQRLVSMGHRTIGVVLRDRRGYGDDLMVDAITQEALSAKLHSAALRVRSVPMDQTLTDLAIRQLLADSDRPTAIICRSRLILASAARICTELHLQIGHDVVLALCDPQSTRHDSVAVPCVRPVATLDAVGEGTVIGQMLTAVNVNGALDGRNYLIPVTLP